MFSEITKYYINGINLFHVGAPPPHSPTLSLSFTLRLFAPSISILLTIDSSGEREIDETKGNQKSSGERSQSRFSFLSFSYRLGLNLSSGTESHGNNLLRASTSISPRRSFLTLPLYCVLSFFPLVSISFSPFHLFLRRSITINKIMQRTFSRRSGKRTRASIVLSPLSKNI